jgi:predicted nucleic acid-binding protein
MRAALSDTTVLSNFAHIERPDLLRALFSPLLAPPSVLEELMMGERRALIPKCSWDWLNVVVPTASEKALAGGAWGQGRPMAWRWPNHGICSS